MVENNAYSIHSRVIPGMNIILWLWNSIISPMFDDDFLAFDDRFLESDTESKFFLYIEAPKHLALWLRASIVIVLTANNRILWFSSNQDSIISVVRVTIFLAQLYRGIGEIGRKRGTFKNAEMVANTSSFIKYQYI